MLQHWWIRNYHLQRSTVNRSLRPCRLNFQRNSAEHLSLGHKTAGSQTLWWEVRVFALRIAPEPQKVADNPMKHQPVIHPLDKIHEIASGIWAFVPSTSMVIGDPLTVITTVALPSKTGNFFICGLFAWLADVEIV